MIDVAQQLDVARVVEVEQAVVVARAAAITGVLAVTAFGAGEVHDDSLADIVIGVAARAREIGQPFLAASASVWNCVASTFGTLPSTSRWMFVIVQPGSCFSMLTVATVLSSVGSKPAFVSWKLSAIVKQPACAAAISSSGFVPALPSSDWKRELAL